MNLLIDENDSFDKPFFKWIDSKENYLYAQVTASRREIFSFVTIRLPLSDKVDKILVTVDDIGDMDHVCFHTVGYYIKPEKKVFLSYAYGMYEDIVHEFDLLKGNNRCVDFDGMWDKFENKWLGFWAGYFLSLHYAIVNDIPSFTPEESLAAFSRGMDLELSKHRKLKEKQQVEEYLSTLYDLPIKEYMVRQAERAITYLIITKDEKLDLLIGYLTLDEQLFAKMRNEMQDASYFWDKPMGNGIVERYCRFFFSAYLKYIRAIENLKIFTPSKQLIRTKKIKKAAEAFYDKTLAGSVKVTFLYKDTAHPYGVVAAASVKLLKLCPDMEELCLHSIKLSSPKELKGLVISEDAPVQAMDIVKVTYRGETVFEIDHQKKSVGFIPQPLKNKED